MEIYSISLEEILGEYPRWGGRAIGGGCKIWYSLLSLHSMELPCLRKEK